MMNRMLLATWPALLLCAACEQPAPSQATPTATATAKATAIATAKAKAKKAKVFFLTPLDGAKVFPKLEVAIGAEGAGDAQAYLIVDGAPVKAGGAMADAGAKTVGPLSLPHTGTELTLTEGEHRLTVQLADKNGKARVQSKTSKVVVVAGQGERKVFFVGLEDGAKVKSPVKLKFGVEGMKVQPAGEAPLDQITGHHHVVIDGGPLARGVALPKDKKHVHFGKGQTETELKLEKGKRKLTLQFADGSHLSYGPKMSQTVSVEVE